MTLRGRHLVVIDVLATIGSLLVTFALRFDAPSNDFSLWLGRFVWVLIILVPARLAALYGLSMYQRVWRYASVGELQAIVAAVLVSSAFTYGVVFVTTALTPGDVDNLPRSIPVMETLIAIALIGGSRFSLRVTGTGRRSGASVAGAGRTLIVGAGNTGTTIARQLGADGRLGLTPVGFVDDDLPKGQRIFGIPVVGRLDGLGAAIEEHGVGTVLLALPSANGKVIRRLVRQCEERHVRALTVPALSELLSGKVSPTTVRDVDVDDLLRRAPAHTDLDGLRELVHDVPVLITGAGGSIGSELARQIAGFRPSTLYLLGRGENSIFEIHEELKDRLHTVPVILDIRETERLDALLRDVRPKVVFHAAAHKHVALMERYPEEAVATNVIGTENLVRSCEATRVERLVLISTDKAVNPTSVMGVTKRVAELIVRDAAVRTGRPYVAVRFGNVLSSRGSVVPILRRQMLLGGPITITDPEVTRYFMTIPEAVQLVLQAALLGTGGEIFVLDMGEPVKILDLAAQLADLHDLELGVDIPISFTGLKPGEKLHEELFFGDEVPLRTSHENIFVARSDRQSPELVGTVAAMRSAVVRRDLDRLRSQLGTLVPEYRAAAATEPTNRP